MSEQNFTGQMRVLPNGSTEIFLNGQWQPIAASKTKITFSQPKQQNTSKQQSATIATPYDSGTNRVYFDGKWRDLKDANWFDRLQEHDWYTLGSIAGDLAGLGMSAAGFTPGAAVAGVTSTTSQLIGDIKRDGFQWRDLGNAALGYGLDATTLFAGPLASGAKNMKKIIQYAPWILKTFGVALGSLGAADAVSALKRVVETGEVTMDDLRSITNGIMGVVSIRNSFKKQSGDVAPEQKQSDSQRVDVNNEKHGQDYYQEYHEPGFHQLLEEEIAQWNKQKQRMAELSGQSKSQRNQRYKPHPLAGTYVSNIEDLMLINRTGGNGIVDFSKGKITWPTMKDGNFSRQTAHFTTDQSVLPHNYGDWDGMPTTILLPYKTVGMAAGRPINIEPMDTYFGNATSLEIPGNTIKVFTGDLGQASNARINGVDVVFSKKSWELTKKIKAINKELESLEKKYNYDLGQMSQYDYNRRSQLYEELYNLKNENRKIHEDFIQSNQTKPTIDTYRALEAEVGLSSGVKSVDGRLTYNPSPTTHYAQLGAAEYPANPFVGVDQFLEQLRKFGYEANPQVFKYKEIDPKTGQLVDAVSYREFEAQKQTFGTLTSDSYLSIIQKFVQSCTDQEKLILKQKAEQIPDNVPNSAKIKSILRGERVFRQQFGGKLNYLNYIQ